MRLKSFLKQVDHDRIVAAIQSAESHSRGEIRVHASNRAVADPQKAAAEQFEKLGPGDRSLLRKLLGPMPQVGRPADARDDPLPQVAREVQDEVADRVHLGPRPPPDLLLAELPEAVLDDFETVLQDMARSPQRGAGDFFGGGGHGEPGELD